MNTSLVITTINKPNKIFYLLIKIKKKIGYLLLLGIKKHQRILN